MTKLVFEAGSTEHADMFSILYQGFVLGVPPEGLRGITLNRDAVRILEKLEEVSHPVTAKGDDGAERELRYTSGDRVRALNAEGGTLELEEAEVAMLVRHLNNVPWKIQASKTVVKVAAWLGDE